MLFAKIFGQPKAVKFLSRALSGNRLAHAYLFTGPDGVGKATTARHMAAILFCREEVDAVPCGHCGGCLKFASDNHPDFIHILPEGAGIKINQVRELKKKLGFSPLESTMRVTLVEDVHTMRREAANSLLKLLEEPPPDNLLLLTADEAEPLLTTITSRCQVIPFYPLPPAEAADVLMRLDPSASREDSLTLAALAEGCPGRAMTLDAEGLLQLHNEILTGLLDAYESEAERTEAALLLAARTAENKEGLIPLFDLLRMFCKDVMVSLLESSRTGSGSSPLQGSLVRARERWNFKQLSDNIDAIHFAQTALAKNCNRQTVCEVLFLQLLAAPENIS